MITLGNFGRIYSTLERHTLPYLSLILEAQIPLISFIREDLVFA